MTPPPPPPSSSKVRPSFFSLIFACLASWALVAVPAAALAEDALLAHWEVSPENPEQVTDRGPNDLHPTMKGSARIHQGEGWQAIAFGPSWGQLEVPSSPEIDRSVSGLTFTARIMANELPRGGAASLVTKRQNWYESSPYILSVGNDGALIFEGNDGTGWINTRSKPRTIKPGQGQHVAFTYSVEDGVRVYVDGRQVAAKAGKQPLQRNTAPVLIGYEKGSQHVHRSPFNGLIREVRLYATPLTSAQINQDRNGAPLTGLAVHDFKPQAAGAERNEAGRLEARVEFGEEAVERGMVFLRNRVEPAEVEVNGEMSKAWRVRGGSAPDAGWVRSLYLILTDERFRNGAMPAVDVEIEYLYNQQAGFDVFADTERGSKRVGGTWGGSSRWRTLRFAIDDAYFGAREHGDRFGVNGVDLRINGLNDDWYVRSIRVVGRDLVENPDFERLLRIQSVTTPDRPIFLFERGESGALDYEIKNIARVPFEGRSRFTLTTHGGREVVLTQEDGFRVEGSSTRELRFNFPTDELKFGVYETRLELFEGSSSEPVLVREGTIGVRSDTRLRKATDDEFWFGLDPSLGDPSNSAPLMAWMEHMGVDIVRNGFARGSEEGDIANYKRLTAAGLRVCPVFDVPRDTERGAFDRAVRKAAERGARFAAEFRPPYWELGNEPDLPFFFPGKMSFYVDGMHTLYDAIKAADPSTTIMNGGLAHAGHSQESLQRTREFFELLDPERLDMVAYHAHGSGAAAERKALRRIREVAAAADKDLLPYVDTETGVAARSAKQEMMQAATCVQKFAYVQSVGHPFMMWFRLLFEQPRSYGNLHSPREPRPAAMAYRAMVEALRGYEFDRLLDLRNDELEGYLFRQIDGDGRVAMLWSNDARTHAVGLTAADRNEALRGVEIRDLFGNVSEAKLPGGGVIDVKVSEMPVYVLWEAAGSDQEVGVAAPLLDGSAMAELASGRVNQTWVRVRNPREVSVDAELRIEAFGELDLSVDPARTSLELGPNESREVAVDVEVGEDETSVDWPSEWTVFAGVRGETDLSRLTSIPSELNGADAEMRFLENHTIVFGEPKERREAVMMAEVVSPVDQTVKIGASADWWMAWYLNGRPVYDTLSTGNGAGYRITDHTFDLPLKAGRNLLAVRVLSGEQGWKLLVGSPEETARALSGTESRNRFELELMLDGSVSAESVVPFRLVEALPLWPSSAWQAPADAWTRKAPFASLGEADVTNPFMVEPDASRWWQGEEDLSARVWLGHDEDKLYLVARVRDQDHSPVSGPAEFRRQDSLELALASADGSNPRYLAVGAGRGEAFKRVSDGLDPEQIDVDFERDHGEKVSVYRIAVSRSQIEGDSFLLNLRINDGDMEGKKHQFLLLRSDFGPEEANPGSWYRAVID